MATNSKSTKNPFQVVVDEVDNDIEMVERPAAKPKRNLEQEASHEMLKREIAQKTLAQIYSTQRKLPVRIAPSYAKYFGNIMRVIVNGVAVAVPCNGQTFNVPIEFACEIERRMREMDAYEMKTSKLADVARNYEPDIGRLSFF
jgi:hypothetical protein